MMGPKKISAIKRDLAQVLKEDKHLEAWLEEQISDLQRAKPTNPRVLEDLLWVRDLLRETVAEINPVATKTGKARTTKSTSKR